MLKPKLNLIMSVALSIFCGVAIASVPTPIPSPSPTCVDFECHFEGGGEGKGKVGGWFQKCHVEGSIDDLFGRTHPFPAVKDDDADGDLTVVCEDGDEEKSKIYDDCLLRYLDLDHQSMTMRGTHYGDPIILVQSFDGEFGRFAADLNFNHNGYNYDIQGSCKFFPDDGLNAKRKSKRKHQ